MQQERAGAAPGLIAGAGSLPLEAARLLQAAGHPVSAIAFEGLTDSTLEGVVDSIRWLRLGRLEDMARALEEMRIERLLLVGKVPKSLLFDGGPIVSPDAEAIRLLSESRDRADEPLMAAIARWLEGRGFRLCDQGETLAPMLAPVGSLGARPPGERELADLAFARSVVEQLGLAGVGQCVVVKQGCVLAVEAIEGTDAVIRRAGDLGGAGATVVKAARARQDRRFDLPAVGQGTIDAMRVAGATALAIEADSTLIVDRRATIDAANRAGIAVWGFDALRSPE